MLTITMSANLQTKIAEYNRVISEQMIAKSALDDVTEKVDDMVVKAGSEANLSNNKSYKKLVEYQNNYELKVASLENQAMLLKNQRDALKSAISNGSKESSFWCFG